MDWIRQNWKQVIGISTLAVGAFGLHAAAICPSVAIGVKIVAFSAMHGAVYSSAVVVVAFAPKWAKDHDRRFQERASTS